jgi:hypothetical protein
VVGAASIRQESAEVTRQEEDEIVRTMESHGGSFASRLGRAFRVADPENFRRLKAAFPELWEHYTELAEMRKERALLK